jgi:hypothetical protein
MKIMHSLLLLLNLIAAINSYGQDCRCPDKINYLITTTEKSYPGFDVKVTPKTQADYEQLVKKIRGSITQDSETCVALAAAYLAFLKTITLG